MEVFLAGESVAPCILAFRVNLLDIAVVCTLIHYRSRPLLMLKGLYPSLIRVQGGNKPAGTPPYYSSEIRRPPPAPPSTADLERAPVFFFLFSLECLFFLFVASFPHKSSSLLPHLPTMPSHPHPSWAVPCPRPYPPARLKKVQVGPGVSSHARTYTWNGSRDGKGGWCHGCLGFVVCLANSRSGSKLEGGWVP